MAQRQYVTYRAPLRSWTQNIAFLGIFNPGRYAGFDEFIPTGLLSFQIGHAVGGVKVRDFNFTQIGPYGTWVSRQGCYISEDGPIGEVGNPNGFNIDSNVGNDFWRYDIIVGEHEYHPVLNQQQPATYKLIKGALNSYGFTGPLLPALTNPDRQVILGIIAVPPQMVDLQNSQVKWIKMKAGDIGDQLHAFLNEPNTFKKTNQENWTPLITYNPEGAGYWSVPALGNGFNIQPLGGGSIGNAPGTQKRMFGFKIDDMPIQDGTKVSLKVNANMAIYNDFLNDTPSNYWYNRGYRPIVFDKRFSTIQLNEFGQLRHILRVSKPFKQTFISQQGIGPSPTQSFMYIDMELRENKWFVKEVYQTQRPVDLAPSLVLLDMYEPTLNATPSTGPSGMPTSQGYLPSVYYINANNNQLYVPAPYVNRQHLGGMPIIQFTGGGYSMGATVEGWFEMYCKMTVRVDMSPMLGNNPHNPLFPGIGHPRLVLQHVKANTFVTTQYTLDEIDNAQLSYQHMAMYVANSQFPRYLTLTLKGKSIIKLEPGDNFVFLLYLDSPQPSMWEWDVNQWGKNSATIKYLGCAEEIDLAF